MEAINSADGTPIFFERTGHGPPLVLVHGGGAIDRRWWEAVLPEITALINAGEKEQALVLLLQEIAGWSPEQIAVSRSEPEWPDRVDAAHTIRREGEATAEYVFGPDRFADMTTPMQSTEKEEIMGAQPAQPGLGTARILATALAAGVTMFWIVGWVLTRGGSEGIAPEVLSSEAALWILLGALILGFAGALVFRGRAVGVSESPGRTDRDLAVEEAAAVQTNLVISWALLEAPALLSGVLFLLLAENLLLWMAVPVYALGVLVTFPRGEWFGEGVSPRARLEVGD